MSAVGCIHESVQSSKLQLLSSWTFYWFFLFVTCIHGTQGGICTGGQWGGHEAPRGEGVLRGGVPPPHWGRGLCSLPRKFLDFWYENGGFLCILGVTVYLRCLFYTHKWCFWSSKCCILYKKWCILHALLGLLCLSMRT